jgi:hypothetical protein
MRKTKAKAPEKTKYLMTPEEFGEFKQACNPGRIVLLNAPQPLSAEERAAIFWNKLADKYRFDASTVEPVLDGEHTLGHFMAVPLPEPTEHDGQTLH